MALDNYALTTLDNLKTHIGYGAGTSDDTELEDHINRASAAIEAYCDRKFISREYLHWDWCSDGCVSLRNWPIVVVRVVASGRRQALVVSMATSGYVSGTVGVKHTEDSTASAVIVQKVDTGGTLTNQTRTLGNYGTTSAMATQITATVSGVTATATINVPSRYLIPTGGRDIFGTTAYLDAADPVSSSIDIDERKGLVRFGIDPFSGSCPTLVIYEAGYATAPYDIENACIRLAARGWIGKREDTGTVAGDFRNPYDMLAVQAEYGSLLAQWKAVR